ncbi:hypothetical protein EVAR_94308_1 [Eumeta japonica]|uniref:Uncharacterized protein n=1 Tax=Eumeta variegata TaxID=151549 RepID=A0A4C1UEV2_EUMVA|nr:hypothetical protein EVAR_94308_1 [Eumeta japonica]
MSPKAWRVTREFYDVKRIVGSANGSRKIRFESKCENGARLYIKNARLLSCIDEMLFNQWTVTQTFKSAKVKTGQRVSHSKHLTRTPFLSSYRKCLRPQGAFIKRHNFVTFRTPSDGRASDVVTHEISGIFNFGFLNQLKKPLLLHVRPPVCLSVYGLAQSLDTEKLYFDMGIHSYNTDKMVE